MISTKTYEQVALEDPEGKWELHGGRLVPKPAMTTEHNRTMTELGYQLRSQLSRNEFDVRINAARTRWSAQQYFIPDVAVLPMRLVRELLARPGTLEVYNEPLPLVVEVWSPSTGEYDTAAKLPEYRRRGDAEVWFIHPYERTLTAWRRQPDGSYTETLIREGAVQPASLPGVTIELASLFDY